MIDQEKVLRHLQHIATLTGAQPRDSIIHYHALEAIKALTNPSQPENDKNKTIRELAEALDSQIEATEQCMDNKHNCEEVIKTAAQFLDAAHRTLRDNAKQIEDST